MRVGIASLIAAAVCAGSVLVKSNLGLRAGAPLALIWNTASVLATALGLWAIIRGPRRARGLGAIAVIVSIYTTVGLIAYALGLRD